MKREETHNAPVPLEDNLKKALTEMLILHLLSDRDYYIGELTATLKEKSGGVLSIVFPYSAVYRLLQSRYIIECAKRTAPDGRRRQYYQITEIGRSYLRQLVRIYTAFSGGVNTVLSGGDREHG